MLNAKCIKYTRFEGQNLKEIGLIEVVHNVQCKAHTGVAGHNCNSLRSRTVDHQACAGTTLKCPNNVNHCYRRIYVRHVGDNSKHHAINQVLMKTINITQEEEEEEEDKCVSPDELQSPDIANATPPDTRGRGRYVRS